MTVMTLHQIFQLAQQLPRRQRRALITLLSNELQAESGMPTTDDAWARLDAFRAELTALGPTTLVSYTHLYSHDEHENFMHTHWTITGFLGA